MNFFGPHRSDPADAAAAAMRGSLAVKKFNTQTIVSQFKRSFDAAVLNELGQIARFFQRERIITPHRLALSLIEAFAFSSTSNTSKIIRLSRIPKLLRLSRLIKMMKNFNYFEYYKIECCK